MVRNMVGANSAPEAVWGALVRLAPARRMAAQGEILATAESDQGSAYLILSGWLCQLRVLEDGRRQILDLFTAGELVPSALPPVKESGVTSLALTASRFCEFDRKRLSGAAESDPALRHWLYLMCVRQRRRLERRIVDLGVRSGSERMARALAELAVRGERGSVPRGALPLGLSLSLRLLGEQLGLSTAHVCRIFKDFEARDIASYNGGSILILDFERLRRAGNVSSRDMVEFAASAANPPPAPLFD